MSIRIKDFGGKIQLPVSFIRDASLLSLSSGSILDHFFEAVISVIDFTPWDYVHTSGNSGFSPELEAFPKSFYAPTNGFTTAVADPTKIYCYPFFVGRQGLTLSKLGAKNTTVSLGGVSEIGIYSSKPANENDIYPQTLVTSVTITHDTTGVKLINSSFVLTNGLYWFAVKSITSSEELSAYAADSQGLQWMGGKNVLGYTNDTQNTGLVATVAANSSLTSTFPTGAVASSISRFVFLME